VEAAGIEPASRRKPGSAKVGQHVSKDGHDGPQVGQVEGVAVCPTCKSRTEAGQVRSKAGRGGSIAGAQRDEGASDAVVELAIVTNSWDGLPATVRRAIVGAVLAFPVGFRADRDNGPET
jgi:hypothetical protein